MKFQVYDKATGELMAQFPNQSYVSTFLYGMLDDVEDMVFEIVNVETGERETFSAENANLDERRR